VTKLGVFAQNIQFNPVFLLKMIHLDRQILNKKWLKRSNGDLAIRVARFGKQVTLKCDQIWCFCPKNSIQGGFPVKKIHLDP
jgi:Pyruvate/2-oxoacid:ferredoxin oxidoreductase delta subunit